MGVVGPPRQRQVGVEFAVARPQPALGDRRVRVDRPHERDLLAVGVEHSEHHEQVGVGRGGRHEQLRRQRSGDLGLLSQRRGEEPQPVTDSLVAQLAAAGALLPAAPQGPVGVQAPALPVGARDRPVLLGPLHEPVCVAHLQQHRRLAVPTCVGPLQEVPEETLLQRHSVVGVVLGPVLDAVDLQPALRRRGAGVGLEVAPRVQSLAAPVGRGQERHRHLVPHRRAVGVVPVVEGVRQDVLAEGATVGGQFLLAERRRPRGQLARVGVDRTAGAEAVLDGLDLHVVPVVPEGAENAAVVGGVPVPLRGALPGDHRHEVRRLAGGHRPLVHGVVRDAREPDLAVAPGLNCGPLDAVVEVLGLPRREVIDVAGRASAAPGVHPQAHVAVGDPLLGVADLPVLVLVGGACDHVGMLLGHAVPGAGVALLKGQTFGVGAVGQQDRVAPGVVGAVRVGAQHQPVVHRYRHIPVDPHAVAHFADGLVVCGQGIVAHRLAPSGRPAAV